MEEIDGLGLTMECALFFRKNPYAFETADSLAIRLGRKSELIQPILNQLVNQSILKKIGKKEPAIYRYNQDDVQEEGF